MKVKEKKIQDSGFQHGRPLFRIRLLSKGEQPPEGAEVVPEETPECDWQADEEAVK